MIRVLLLGVLLGLAGAAGCSAGSGQATVSGEVTLDGEPLRKGLIRFVPVDGKTPTADAEIVDGRFTATVPPGEKRVEITASRVVGKTKMIDTPEGPTVDQVEEMLPPEYHVRSKLTMTVTPGSQQKRFELKSRP
jgi:hypothetical protein